MLTRRAQNAHVSSVLDDERGPGLDRIVLDLHLVDGEARGMPDEERVGW